MRKAVRLNQCAVLIISALTSLGLFVACSEKPSGPEIKTIPFVSDGTGYIKFSTNDPDHCSKGHIRYYDSTDAPISVITADLKKNAGASDQAFGVIFSYTPTNNWYRVMIDLNEHFRIDQCKNNIITPILEWAINGALNTGYEEVNTIAVTYSTPDLEYIVTINGAVVATFLRDVDIGVQGKSGFYASIGSAATENFPDNSVDVRFKMTAPVTLP